MTVDRASSRSRWRPAGSRSGRSPFLVRWVLAVAVAMVLGGLVEYVVAVQQLVDSTLRQSTRSYQAQVRELEDVMAEDLDPVRRATAIEDQLDHIGRYYGTLYVGLFDAAGRPVGGVETDASDPSVVDPKRLAKVVSTRQATVEVEAEAGEVGQVARYEFLLPVEAPEGLLVLEIDQHADIVAELVADLRKRKALGLLVAVLLAVPLSYVLGGRTLHRRQLRSEREAVTDALTGLAARRPFRPVLEAALARDRHPPVALALIDLDGFKQVNDRFGHSYGDQVLIGLADSFEGLRATDSAFRLGGDEFAVVLPGSDDQQSSEVLDRVRTCLAGRFPEVTFSCGIASSPAGQVMALQELWERSDAALYEAKRRGRRQTVIFETMSARHTVSAEKLDAVTALLAEDSAITAAFQPIWDLRRGVVLAHEALLRLPAGTAVNGPQEAFELAQRLGVAAALDARARRAVLAAVRDRAWHGPLFLNVHPDALAALDVDALVVEIAAAGLEPADVVLEVTEQAGLDQPEPIRVLKRAHQRGFRLALDDMGHSNAGLRALTHVRFDIVKLDRQVVARLGGDPASAATVAAATTFVQLTGGWVIAEGIEDAAMLAAVLRGTRLEAGREPVLAGQGYLLGRPHVLPLGLEDRLPVLDERHPCLVAE